jgi:prepilin-type N-terminal cleavage/methylation domain-containing protein
VATVTRSVVSGDGRRLFVLIPKSKKEAGVSLVELLVVMVIIAIVMTMAILSRGDANELFQRQNASGELKIAFERARFDSVKRRADVEPFPPASVQVRADGFTLTTYTREGTATTATPHNSVKSFPTGVVASHFTSGTLPMTISFNRRGETAGGVAQFRITDTKTGTSDIILVTPTGTVNLISGSSTPPTFPTPTLVSSPLPTESIDQHVVVP